jgi:tetratricopeptide (TPR) repeat protein
VRAANSKNAQRNDGRRIMDRCRLSRFAYPVAAAAALGCAGALAAGSVESEASVSGAMTAVLAAAAPENFAGAICHAPGRAGSLLLAATQAGRAAAGATYSDPTAFADSDPPLWPGLGSISYRVTTRSAEAQRFFDQGLRLTYAFNHAEARRAFRKAQKLDPECAKCFWGEALVLGPNINMPMPADDAKPAFAALTRARERMTGAAAHERALIEALSARYAANPPANRSALDRAYAEAMGRVAAQFPDDDEIAVLYAEALMDLSPWDYWERDGVTPRPRVAALVPTLERVLARAPNHPGAIHYYIHAVEASNDPQRAERHADRLRGAMPGAGHLVHMPSHIYFRLGRYRDMLDDNRKAVAIDEEYLAATNAPLGMYRLGYYPHNVHFVLAAAQRTGDGATAIDAAGKLSRLIPDAAARTIAAVQPVKVAPYFAHVQFSPPETLLALPEPGESMPYVKAMWHYARGIGFAALERTDEAEAQRAAIGALERTTDFAALTAAGIPGMQVMQIAQLVLEGRILQSRRDFGGAADRFEQAVVIQDDLPYMEPPYWYYPVRQSLGAALIQAGRLDDAERALQRSLYQSPNNGWSQYGLMELYRARGDDTARRAAEETLQRIWIGDRSRLSLSSL